MELEESKSFIVMEENAKDYLINSSFDDEFKKNKSKPT
jgi:hypothetical protein